jgi:hypothetical protein
VPPPQNLSALFGYPLPEALGDHYLLLVAAHFHSFEVARLGQWITRVNGVGATPTAPMCARLPLAITLLIGRGYMGLWVRRTPSGACGEGPYR